MARDQMAWGFLPGVPAEHVLDRLRGAGGQELTTGKLLSEQSSAALAVNTFGWFIERPQVLPPLPGMQVGWEAPLLVDVEYCARFPWAGGRHPWLDAVIETETMLIGIESKRYEPFRDKKVVSLSAAYDRAVWGERMGPFEAMRDRLRSGAARYRFLDAAQLVKHAFGLVTDGRRRNKRPVLFYLYAEPAPTSEIKFGMEDLIAHRMELIEFSDAVSGAEVEFIGASYDDWLAGWEFAPPEVWNHRRAIMERFRI